MTLLFPSEEFDSAVSAVCHDTASDEQIGALNELLRSNASARDEYILRLEIHSRLASDPELFTTAEAEFTHTAATPPPRFLPATPKRRHSNAPLVYALGLAACLLLATLSLWSRRSAPHNIPIEPTSLAVAMLGLGAGWTAAT